MMLGLQGNTSSPKVYRCVACSTTFTGLASLLVHQATHANTVTKVPATSPQPSSHTTTGPHETLFASMDSSGEHNSPPTFLTESASPSFYICDCGEEFQDFSLMLEHKSSHVSQIRLLQPQDDNIVFSDGTGCANKFFPTQHVSFSPTVTQPGLDLCRPSTSRSPPVKLSTLTDHKADVTPGEEVAIVTNSQCTSQQENLKKLDMSSTAETFPETIAGEHFKDKTNSVPGNEKGTNLPKSNSIMKMLASAYMKCSSPSELDTNSDKIVTPKQEVVPLDITPGPKPEVSPVNDLSVVQLRRLLSKPGIKTKAPSISKILESSKKRVVSLTKTFSPVVVLETRQKLMDPVGNGVYGRYQCGRCRRVFPHLDRLTEHHFLHKKERIKCCRHCKQLIIGRVPLPDSHTCPQLGNRAIPPMRSCQKKLPLGQKIVPFHGLSSTKKVYFCPLCKHSYARRWNLKMHKCQGPIQNRLILTSNSTANTDTQLDDESHFVKSVAVGTEVAGHIKVELMSQNSDLPGGSKLAWNLPSSAKSFPSFDPKQMMEHNKDASVCGVSPQQGEEYSWNLAAVDDGEGQWTMPLDDEMEVLHSARKAVEGGEVRRSASVQPAEMTSASLRYFVRDGVKWYPCNRCQKTYSQASTLRRHLRLCGFRPPAPGTAAQDAITLNANHMKPVFACAVCGKTFNRKDNMMVHSKKCQLRQSMSDVDRRTMQQSESVSATDGQTPDDDGGHWGIMSLPSVLPRRVTCECGVGFTSPKLLLEHLQKHAQESYTCPTCGETVSSWADYEVHLQIHMHPHHQLLKGLQPSQPLLLRFQQQPPQQPPPPPPPPPPPSVQQPAKQPRAEHFPNSTRKKQRIVCTRCGNTFASRCSLRRHVSWNRCKGPRIASVPTNPQKTHHCSQCNSDFPNSISLSFHQRSGTCKPMVKPAVKPVRCPVCLRWFSTVDGLQKHLLTHKRPEAHRCDICQGTYANIKSLKTHRRKIHRIMAGDKRQNQLVTSQ